MSRALKRHIFKSVWGYFQRVLTEWRKPTINEYGTIIWTGALDWIKKGNGEILPSSDIPFSILLLELLRCEQLTSVYCLRAACSLDLACHDRLLCLYTMSQKIFPTLSCFGQIFGHGDLRNQYTSQLQTSVYLSEDALENAIAFTIWISSLRSWLIPIYSNGLSWLGY